MIIYDFVIWLQAVEEVRCDLPGDLWSESWVISMVNCEVICEV